MTHIQQPSLYQFAILPRKFIIRNKHIEMSAPCRRSNERLLLSKFGSEADIRYCRRRDVITGTKEIGKERALFTTSLSLYFRYLCAHARVIDYLSLACHIIVFPRTISIHYSLHLYTEY